MNFRKSALLLAAGLGASLVASAARAETIEVWWTSS
jgi:hypothetical protein